MKTSVLILITLCCQSSVAQDQRYYEGGQEDYYGGDAGGGADDGANIYADYAQKQQEKADKGGGGGGLKWLVLGGASGFGISKLMSRKESRVMKKKHAKEIKQLYTQYYSDVYKLQEALAEANYATEQLRSSLTEAKTTAEMEAIQRDYDEFKQPDVDGDDRISRAEFNMYVKNYLANYPGLQEKDYPRFEDFDHDKDGFVSFTEYAQQMAYQVQQAELEKFYAGDTKAANLKAQALSGLAGDAQKGKNFNDLYANYR